MSYFQVQLPTWSVLRLVGEELLVSVVEVGVQARIGLH